MPIEPRVPFEPPPAQPADTAARERQLVDGVLRKDRKAAAQLVAEHADAVHAYVRHRLAPRLDQVDDVVQEVFIAAFGSLSAFRGVSPLRAWLLGIARHKIEDYYRQRLRGDQVTADADEAGEIADGDLSVEEHIDRSRAAARTQRVLAQLPESYGIALLWRYWESRSVRDIAEATGKTEKAVERLLARARTRFRELWERDSR